MILQKGDVLWLTVGEQKGLMPAMRECIGPFPYDTDFSYDSRMRPMITIRVRAYHEPDANPYFRSSE